MDIFEKSNVGLFRDDGLVILPNPFPNRKKKLMFFYKSLGLGIRVEEPLVETDFQM